MENPDRNPLPPVTAKISAGHISEKSTDAETSEVGSRGSAASAIILRLALGAAACAGIVMLMPLIGHITFEGQVAILGVGLFLTHIGLRIFYKVRDKRERRLIVKTSVIPNLEGTAPPRRTGRASQPSTPSKGTRK